MPGLNPLQLAALAAAVSLLVIPLMSRLAPRLGLVDVPDARKVHRVPVPRVGGWGISLGMLIPLLLWVSSDPLVPWFVIGALILFVFGVWDDARSTGHWTKFLGQILASGALVLGGGLYISSVPFLDGVTLSPAVGKPFTFFALIVSPFSVCN